MKKFDHVSIKRNNEGSALVVAIVVLLFVSILATIMLYLSGINYRMKKSDLNTRISFYSAETPLETIQSNLVIPLSYTMSKAYMSTNSRYMTFTTADDRRDDFYQTFYDELEDLMITEYGGGCAEDIIDELLYGSSYPVAPGHIYCGAGTIDDLTSAGAFPDNFTSNPEVYIVLPDALATGASSDMFESFCKLHTDSDPDKCRIEFKNIGVVVCQNGYRSHVTTDIVMQFPPLDWDGGISTSTSFEDTKWDVYQLLYYINWEKS